MVPPRLRRIGLGGVVRVRCEGDDGVAALGGGEGLAQAGKVPARAGHEHGDAARDAAIGQLDRLAERDEGAPPREGGAEGGVHGGMRVRTAEHAHVLRRGELHARGENEPAPGGICT